jgi:hypothetical protein
MTEDVKINIRDEISRYTDEHFMNKLNEELEKVRKTSRFMDNSPISMSNPTSDSEGNGEDGLEEGDYFETDVLINYQKQPGLKRLTFKEVRDSINKYYETDDKYSNELDILQTYLKGQKHIFSKAVDIIQIKTTWILIPAALGSATITIIAPIIREFVWSGIFISGLNALVFVLFFICYYCKLMSSDIVYRQLSSQYERLEHSLDINKLMESGKDRSSIILEVLKESEKKLADLKETSILGLPSDIKVIFPILYNVHIFTFIKRIEVYKKNLIIKFKDVKNEIRYIEWKWGEKIENKEKTRLEFLCKIKEKIKNEILHYKNAYGCMDELMTKEIKRADQMPICLWTSSSMSKRMNIDNPVVSAYFSTIFED